MTTHIDGVRFLSNGDPKLARKAMLNYKENLRSCGDTLNDEPSLNNPHQIGVWYGVMNNNEFATTAFPPKGEKKLVKVQQLLNQKT